MYLAAYEQYLNFAGQPAARLYRGQSIYHDSERGHTFFFGLLSLLLFCAPDTHLEALEGVYSDYQIHYEDWNALIQRLRKEWEDINIYVRVYHRVHFLSHFQVPGYTASCV